MSLHFSISKSPQATLTPREKVISASQTIPASRYSSLGILALISLFTLVSCVPTARTVRNVLGGPAPDTTSSLMPIIDSQEAPADNADSKGIPKSPIVLGTSTDGKVTVNPKGAESTSLAAKVYRFPTPSGSPLISSQKLLDESRGLSSIQSRDSITEDDDEKANLESPPRRQPDLLTKASFFSFNAHNGEINSLVVSKDGIRAFSGGNDGIIVESTLSKADPEYNRPSSNKAGRGAIEVTVKPIFKGAKPILALALSPDDRYLAVAQFSEITIIDLGERIPGNTNNNSPGKVSHHLTQVPGRLISLAWDPRGELLAFGRTNGDIFVWNIDSSGGHGANTQDDVETYSGGNSPVLALLFHPSGRAFFAAEQDGTVNFWRIIRTERELGLRDDFAEIDKELRGSRVIPVTGIGAPVEDLWLAENGSLLLFSSPDGTIYQWKVRGLKRQNSLRVGKDSSMTVRPFSIPLDSYKFSRLPSGSTLPLLATTGRSQRVKLWCATPKVPLEQPDSRAPVPIISSAPPVALQTPDVIDGQLVVPMPTSTEKKVELPKEGLGDEDILLAESEPLGRPISQLRNGQDSLILWAAEKTGNLVVFDATGLEKSGQWLNRAVKVCETLEGSTHPTNNP